MSSPVLKGQVVYEDHGSSIWGKLGSILSGAGHVIASALPYVAQAASIYASSRGGSSNTSDYNGVSWDLPNQNNRRSLAMPIPEPVALRPITDYKSEPIARNALDKIKQQQDYRQPSTPNWADMQARNQQILNELAAVKGLPSYQQFHQDSGVVYDFRPEASQLGVERFIQLSHQSNGFIQEDVRQIQDNLSHARPPVSTGLKRQPIQSQSSGIRPVSESPALHQMIMRSNEARSHVSRQAETIPALPDSFHRGLNVTDLVKQGHVPKDDQIKQLLHTLDLQHAGARNPFDKRQAAIAEQWLKQKLAQNMISGPDAILNSDGYVVIGNQAYGNFEALNKALADIEHFKVTERHLPGLSYPTNSRLPKQAYPDVTNMVSKELRTMIPIVKREAGKGFWQGTKPLFEKMFKNNGPWDMQVGHGLPGQVIVRDQSGKALPDKDEPGRYETIDQFALFNGEIHRAGYISNYVFGQSAAAAAGIPKEIATTIAHAIAIKDGIQKGRIVLDNPDDQRAIRDGWDNWADSSFK